MSRTRHAKAVRDSLGLTIAYVEQFEAEAKRLINTSLTDAAFHALTSRVFAPADAPQRVETAEREREQHLSRLWAEAATHAGIRGTAWAGIRGAAWAGSQAVVDYVDHYTPVRTTGEKAQARVLRLMTSDAPTKIKHAAEPAVTPGQGPGERGHHRAGSLPRP